MVRCSFATSVLLFSLVGGSLVGSLVRAEPAIHPDEGLKHLSWTDAQKAVGENAFISGKVINVGSAGRVNFLNFTITSPTLENSRMITLPPYFTFSNIDRRAASLSVTFLNPKAIQTQSKLFR